MMDSLPENKDLLSALVSEAEKAQGNAVKRKPFIVRYRNIIAACAAGIAIVCVSVGVVPKLMEKPAVQVENDAEQSALPTSSATDAAHEYTADSADSQPTDTVWEEIIKSDVTAPPVQEPVPAGKAETSKDSPSYGNTAGTGTAANKGQIYKQSRSDNASENASDSFSEDAPEAVTQPPENDTASEAQNYTAQSAPEKASYREKSAEQDNDSDEMPEVRDNEMTAQAEAANGPDGADDKNISVQSSGAASGGNVSVSSSSAASGSSGGASGGSSSSASATSAEDRSHKSTAVGIETAEHMSGNAPYTFIISGITVGIYNDGGAWSAYYVKNNAGYMVVFTGYDSADEIRAELETMI